MNQECNRTSEHAVRDVLGRRRRAPATSTSDRFLRRSASPAIAVNGATAVAASGASAPAGQATPLRRWSVAQLVARAAVAPRADGPVRG